MSAVATIGQIERSLLQVRSLHKNFGGVKAVSDISFDVPAGSIFSVIGPNGAGKSTLLNLISGVYQPDSGSLSFNGTALVGHAGPSAGAARYCADVPEDPSLQAAERVGKRDRGISCPSPHPGMAIRDAWRALLRPINDGVANEPCSFCISLAMSGRLDVLAGSLSYGEQRMLELARALATKPQLLLIDEPAAGLNAAEVDGLLDRIRSLRNDGMTVILVEHNMDLVMNVADRIMVMDYGRRLFEGSPAEVQKNPAVIAAYLGGELL